MLERHGLERRLFGWLFALAVLPTLVVLAVALAANQQLLDWVGTLGPWERIGESGREVYEVADSLDLPADLRVVLDVHRSELEESLQQALRWNLLGSRLSTLIPLLVLGLALIGALAALLVSRRLARDLARPVRDLVGWTYLLARNEPLPEASASESREVSEVRTLRRALREASERIAEARRTELETERVRVWGEMARRVAHEMKNPLTPLRLATHRLSGIADGEPTAAEAIRVITEETARLEDLAREFATLGRPSRRISRVDVGELMATLLETDVPAAIERSLDVAPGTPELSGDYDTLLRAFRNLIRNGVEAMAGNPAARSPVLRVQVSAVGLAGPSGTMKGTAVTGVVAGSSEGPGQGGAGDRWIEVRIADSGAGLPAGAAERIFEPDFSGKPGGTGLGLAVVRQVVSAHGGSVQAHSRVDGGAEFVVLLPAAADAGE